MLRKIAVGTLAISTFALADCSSKVPVAPQIPADANVQAHKVSWMLPEAKRVKTLVYAMGWSNEVVYAFAYPAGRLEGEISLSSPGADDICSDNAGNLWVPERKSSYYGQIVKYKHGGTEPVATLSNESVPAGCAVDSVTGNLAVIDGDFSSNSEWV